jgi:hypothetical protein
MEKIQIIVVIISVLFATLISWYIVKGKLREEYAVVWFICSIILIIFALWRKGIEYIADFFGVVDAPNLIFTTFIFIILIYLLHLSINQTKMRKNVKEMAQEIAFLKLELEKSKNETKL